MSSSHRDGFRLTRHARLGIWLVGAVVLLVPASARSAELPPEEDQDGQSDFWSQLENMKAGPFILDLGGQLRLRYEHDENFTIKGYQPGGDDELLLERVRLDVAARLQSGPRMFLQLQDAHAFLTQFDDDDFPASSPIEDTLDIRQLYVEWLPQHGSPVGARLGRQQISYGDQRVFGPGNWGNTGRYAWDAAMLKVDTEGVWIDLWVGRYLLYKSEVWPDRSVDDFLTFVGYTQLERLPFRLDLFYVIKHDTSERIVGESGAGDLLSHTVGFQAEGSVIGSVDAGATMVAQAGSYGEDGISAFGASLKLGVAAPVAASPRLGVQYTWGSGDSDPTDGVHETFDGVYGGRDIAFYGYLNLFVWANLRDAEIDLRLEPSDDLTLYVEYHRFKLDQPTDAWYTTGLTAFRRDPTGGSGTTLGDEFDLRAAWTLGDHLELMTGGGRFFPGTFVENTGPSSQATWYFAQAAYAW